MIRLFQDSDANTCRDLIKRCFEQSVELKECAKQFIKNKYIADNYLELKSRKYPFFVYSQDEHILAIGAVEGNEIKKIYVNPLNQGNGIGSEMLKYLEKIAITYDKSLVLYAFKNSISFYEKNGYSVVGNFVFEIDGVKISTIKMQKTL